jgi:RNA-directed DNA polymerase
MKEGKSFEISQQQVLEAYKRVKANHGAAGIDGITFKASGTPQGGVCSATYANLFMHYAFDRWMVTQNPNNPWERYADDGVVHCHTQDEAERLLERLKKRLRACKLELHPDKTRIVYCRSDQNRGRYEHESFDFLGYTFRTRQVRSKSGCYFNAFTPAVSKAAVQQFRDKMREGREQGILLTPEEMAKKMNPIIRGWANYFTQFNRCEARVKALDYVNLMLVRWARRKYKRFNHSPGKAFSWLGRLAKKNPNLFYHWQLGIRPATG